MENLLLSPTNSTPGISLDKDKNVLSFDGESRPENVIEYYKPVISWAEEYNNHIFFISKQTPDREINIEVNFKMQYFNSTSAKYIFDFFNAISRIEQYPNVSVLVNWHSKDNDEDMQENGEDFEDITSLKFKFFTY